MSPTDPDRDLELRVQRAVYAFRRQARTQREQAWRSSPWIL